MQPNTHSRRKGKIVLKEITGLNFKEVVIKPQKVTQVVEACNYITSQHKLNISKTNDFKRAQFLLKQMSLNN